MKRPGLKFNHLIFLDMALMYKVVERRDMRAGAAEGAKRWYAQGYVSGITLVEDLYGVIADRSTATAGDVKLIIDGLVHVLVTELRKGLSVQVGELGTFRPSLHSAGSDTKEGFSSSMLRQPSIVFFPGKLLRESRKLFRVEKMDEPAESKDPEGGL